MSEKLAKFISITLHPLISGAIFFLYLSFFREKLDIYQSVFIFLLDFLIPVIFIFFLLKKKIVTDVDISDVTKRKYFYFPSLMMLLLTLPLFLVFRIPTILILAQLELLAFIIFWAVISLFYKISGHVGGASLVYTMIVLLVDKNFWPIFFLLPILAWSRVKLKQHSLDQTIAGGLLGFLISFIVFRLLGSSLQ